MGKYVAGTEETINSYKILKGKSGRRWDDNIVTYPKQVGLRLWTGFSWLRMQSSGTL
jgi:hypothetical protein